MEELIFWVTNGVNELTPHSIVAIMVITIICESLSVAVGHIASVGRN